MQHSLSTLGLCLIIASSVYGQNVILRSGEYIDMASETDTVSMTSLTMEPYSIIAIPFSRKNQVFRLNNFKVNGKAFIITYLDGNFPEELPTAATPKQSEYGDNGNPGSPGIKGVSGSRSPAIQFRTPIERIDTLVIIGIGGYGGRGQQGGNGGKGGAASCSEFSNGGNGGKAGFGGDGGNGGQGSTVTFFYSGEPIHAHKIDSLSIPENAIYTPSNDVVTGTPAAIMLPRNPIYDIGEVISVVLKRSKSHALIRKTIFSSTALPKMNFNSHIQGSQGQAAEMEARNAVMMDIPIITEPAFYDRRGGVVAYLFGGDGGMGGYNGKPGEGGEGKTCIILWVGKKVLHPGSDGEIESRYPQQGLRGKNGSLNIIKLDEKEILGGTPTISVLHD